MFVRFDLLSDLHDQKEYDNYFVICRKANMLATLKIKIEIIYSLVNPCGKNKHRYPSNKEKKKETEETNSVAITHTRLQEDKKLYPNDLLNKHG